ncbi:MAG: alpha-2-macroglobulin, partial [Bacteroidales bacterium]|nr:alpha-2-macroglobulin [Bacteroidales bacterium]
DGLKGFVYGDRGVWRPGDTLHVGLFVFDRAGNLPESHPVNVEIFTPQGQFYTKLTSAKGKNGLYVFNIPTAENDPTGTWHSYFKVGGATFHKALPIETIKANRLKINVKFNNEILQNSTEEKAEISSSWLAGPLASGLKTSMNMTLYKSSFKFDKYKDYTFTNPADSFEASEYEIYSGVLDEKGKTDVSFRMPAAADAPGMLQAAVVCKVQEPGGDESIMTTTKYFSPFSAYVGLKVPENNEDGNLETDKDLKFDVVLVDKNQTPVGGHNLEYHIWKLDWRWWWESGYESLASYVNGSYSEEVAKGKLSSSGNMSFNFKVDYPGWGRYLVYVKDTKGGHAAGKVIYVDWPSWRGRSAKGDPSALAMLSFSTDKNSYKVGESATVYIPAAKGRALVSLENGSRVISRKWVSANEFGDTPYKFDITADMAPNFYVHVTLLQPHAQRGSDLPIRLYGVVPVTVENPASHLEPVIKMKDEIRPQEQFTVKVSEKNNKPMSYTLAIVDEGLLDITSFKTPDPWNAMYRREALGVKTWDLYDDVIGAYSGSFNPLLSIGGDENLKVGNKQDNRFNPVVAYLGPFTLDKGENTHKITLPMYVGSVRVMVVAGANGAYGNAEKSVPVKAPLMILSSFPKIVGTSEKISLPVNIFSMEDKPMNASVKVTVEGPAKVSENSKSVNCAPNSSQVADFEIVTGSNEGTLKVTINAEGAGFKASETSYIEVKNPNPPITTVSRKAVGKGKSVDLSFAPFEASGSDRATLEIAAFPSLDFNKCYNFFMDYPYSCSEQISSRGIGLVAMKKYLTQEQASKIDSIIPGLLGQIYSRQLPDGGFVYWPGASMADEWVTSMAGHFLTVAAANGYQISSTVYQKWLGYQRKASNNYKRSEQQIFDMVQAYRLFTLALSSNPDHGAMNRLKERSDLSVSSQWLLAAAYSLQG